MALCNWRSKDTDRDNQFPTLLDPVAMTFAAFTNAGIAPSTGALQVFTDSDKSAWGATITGGGSNVVMGFFNGTVWKVMGA